MKHCKIRNIYDFVLFSSAPGHSHSELIILRSSKENTKVFEPAHDRTYSKTYATSKDPDQPAHQQNQGRAVPDCMRLLKPLSYQRGIKKTPCHTRRI